MIVKSSQINAYFSWILRKYEELKMELKTREAYQILEINRKNSGISTLKICIVGTGKVVEYSPEEIISDDVFLDGFSKKDIRTISYYAYANLNKPKFEIIKQCFSEKLKNFVFTLKKQNSNIHHEKTAIEIAQNSSLIKELSSNDAYRIGYMFGCESILMEKQEKNRIKNLDSN